MSDFRKSMAIGGRPHAFLNVENMLQSSLLAGSAVLVTCLLCMQYCKVAHWYAHCTAGLSAMSHS